MVQIKRESTRPGPVLRGPTDAFRRVHDKKPGTVVVFPCITCTYRYATPVRGLGYTPLESVRKIKEFLISEHVQIGESRNAICTIKTVYFEWPNAQYILCRVH